MEADFCSGSVCVDDVYSPVWLDDCGCVPDTVVVCVAGDDPRGAGRAGEACAGLRADGDASDGLRGDADFRLWE